MEDNNDTNPLQEEISIKKSPVQNIENYNVEIDIKFLQSIQQNIELALEYYVNKLKQSKENNLILKHKEISIKHPEYSKLFIEKELLSEIDENKKYDVIFDCLNFYHFGNDNSPEISEGKIDINLLGNLYNKYLIEKGIILLLCDFQYLCQLFESFKKLLGEKYMTKIFIKLYIILLLLIDMLSFVVIKLLL